MNDYKQRETTTSKENVKDTKVILVSKLKNMSRFYTKIDTELLPGHELPKDNE